MSILVFTAEQEKKINLNKNNPIHARPVMVTSNRNKYTWYRSRLKAIVQTCVTAVFYVCGCFTAVRTFVYLLVETLPDFLAGA